jgi:hypothetical protein
MCLQVGRELFQLYKRHPGYFKVPQSTYEFGLLHILDFYQQWDDRVDLIQIIHLQHQFYKGI